MRARLIAGAVFLTVGVGSVGAWQCAAPRSDVRHGRSLAIAWPRQRAVLSSAIGDGGVAIEPPTLGDGGMAPSAPEVCRRLRVESRHGEVRAGAVVLIEAYDVEEGDVVSRVEGWSDAAGGLELCVPEGLVTIDAWSDGAWGRRSGRWQQSSVPIVVRVTDSPELRVHVRDERGAAIEGARVFLARASGGSHPRQTRRSTLRASGRSVWSTDERGDVCMPIAGAALGRVNVFADGYLTRSVGPVPLRPGEVSEVHAVLSRAGRLCVNLTSGGRPLRTGTVADREGTHWAADEAGQFCMGGLDPAVVHRLQIAAEGHLAEHVRLRVGEHSVPLRPAATLRLRIRLDPAIVETCGVGVTFFVTPEDAPGSGLSGGLSTGVWQTFEVEPGPATVSASVGRLGLRHQEPIELRVGEVSEVDLLLAPLDGHGLVAIRGVERAVFMTGAMGRVELDGACTVLPVGRYEIATERGERPVRVHVYEGEITEAQLPEEAPAEVETRPDSEPQEPHCTFPVTFLAVEQEIWVRTVDASASSLLPGDLLDRVDRADLEAPPYLDGLGRHTYRIDATRPDGSRLTEMVDRRCPRD